MTGLHRNDAELFTVRCSRNTGIMFLNEVVLGNEHDITMDNWQLTEPPKGYDSIIARGHTEPGELSLIYL